MCREVLVGYIHTSQEQVNLSATKHARYTEKDEYIYCCTPAWVHTETEERSFFTTRHLEQYESRKYISTSCVHKYVASEATQCVSAFEHRNTAKTHIRTQAQLAGTGIGFVRVYSYKQRTIALDNSIGFQRMLHTRNSW